MMRTLTILTISSRDIEKGLDSTMPIRVAKLLMKSFYLSKSYILIFYDQVEEHAYEFVILLHLSKYGSINVDSA